MQERLMKILHLLNKYGNKSGSDLARQLGVTSRTIRSDMKRLNEFLDPNIAEINAVPHKGYFLRVKDRSALNDLLDMNFCGRVKGGNERVEFVIRKLLIDGEAVKEEETADQWFVSKNVISADVRRVREYFALYGLQLKHDRKRGLYLAGTEMSRRLCIADFISSHGLQNLKRREKIKKICRSVFDRNSFYVPEHILDNLVAHIEICIMRLEKGNAIFLNNETLQIITMTPEFIIAGELVEILNMECGYRLPVEETAYICLHLCGKKTLGTQDKKGNLVIDQSLYDLAMNMLKRIRDVYKIDLTNDINLLINLSYHLIPMITRIQYKMWIKNPLIEDIKSKYSSYYLITKESIIVLEEKYETSIPDDEVGYLALHIGLSMEKSKADAGKKVLIVCSSGRGSSEMIKHQILKKFGEKIRTADAVDLNQLKETLVEEYDLIFTTVPIQRLISKPIIYISTILNHSEIQQIENLFENSRIEEYLSVFSEELFLTHLTVKNKEETLRLLCNHIENVEGLNRETLYNSMMEREKISDTALGNLTAIPHPNEALADRLRVCIAILEQPVKWGKSDAQFIFILLVPRKVEKELYEFYEITTSLLLNKEIIKNNIIYQNFEFFKKSLKELESGGV